MENVLKEFILVKQKLVTQSDGTTMTLTVKTAAQFKDLSYVSVVKKVNGNEE